MKRQIGISESYDIHVLMSSIEEENLAARMILAEMRRFFPGNQCNISRIYWDKGRSILKFTKVH